MLGILILIMIIMIIMMIIAAILLLWQYHIETSFELETLLHLMDGMLLCYVFQLNTVLLQMLAGQIGLGALQQTQGKFLSVVVTSWKEKLYCKDISFKKKAPMVFVLVFHLVFCIY